VVEAGIVRWVALSVTAWWLAAWSSAACALNPALEISQYGHTAWRNLDGLGQGTIGAIAQTSDGYMWLGTSNGLLRFDGVRSVAWRAPSGTALPDDRVQALRGARDGTLWIGTWRGLASWKHGELVTYPLVKGKNVSALEEDADGTIWVGGSDGAKGFLCAVRKERSECYDDGRFGRAVVALHRDAANALWVSGTDRVWKWTPQSTDSYLLPSPIGSLRAMTRMPNGGIVVGTQGQIVKLANGRAEALPLPAWADSLLFTKVLSDRDGGLWLSAADFGLLHWHEGRLDVLRASDGLSGDTVLELFEDREGNVWVSTSQGLDKFRPMAGATQSRSSGVKGRARAVVAASDGTVWASTTKGAYRWTSSQVSEVWGSGPASLFEDRLGRVWMASVKEFGYFEAGRFVAMVDVPAGIIDGMADDSRGTMWVAHRDAGLLRLLPDGKVERTPWTSLGRPIQVSTLTVDPTDDSLWLGLWSGAVMNVFNGQVRSSVQVSVPGVSPRVNQIRADPNGTLWVASGTAGLSRIKRGRVTNLNRDSGMPCDGVFGSLVDEHFVWIYAICGLVQVDRAEIDAWGAAADQGTARGPRFRLLDQWDGVALPATFYEVGQLVRERSFMPKLARSRDGRIWIATRDGVVTVDPARIPVNSVPPPVHVERIVSDGIPHEARAGLRLPPLQRNLQIDYTGISLTVPERVQFRYKLEGRDSDWQDAGVRRQAFYTDLPPGRYRFSVIAANNSGVWNTQGDALEFSIAPAWWQADMFRLASVAAIALVAYALYRMRVSRLSRQFNLSHEARVNERLRIARELHDTLLQSFQGVLLRLQTALQVWPDVQGRRILEESIDQAAGAITEGRDAVQGLRASATDTHELADALRALGETLALDPSRRGIALSMEVQGHTRSLHRVVRDDVFHIAGEALRNAFRHAEPRRVEVEIRYDERQLRVRIRDDGKGMDPAIAQGGREGHFGLRGMRERARLIGAKLTFWSRLDAGTEVEVTVPGARAYAVAADEPPSTSAVVRAEEDALGTGS
jgi:signal transduction histidine kinase/ligand-binding sensor domain-containing protein